VISRSVKSFFRRKGCTYATCSLYKCLRPSDATNDRP
jgi:hypothetical protein